MSVPADRPCTCYQCAGPEYRWINGHKTLVNNFQDHTYLEPCRDCGRPKTEYLDLGTKGRYTCWWCSDRTAATGETA